MAASSSSASPSLPPSHRRLGRSSAMVRCLPGDKGAEADPGGAPPPLRLAVSAVTEFLRLVAVPKNPREEERSGGVGGGDGEGTSPPRCADDVVAALRFDYGRAYFLTGNFNAEIYSEDCLYEDPTISFRGREKYARNLQLLVPFFDDPSLTLEKIEKVGNDGHEFISAKWKLRTHLTLPWRPLVLVGGTTKYALNRKFEIVRHSESWDISALEAIGQIVSPARGR